MVGEQRVQLVHRHPPGAPGPRPGAQQQVGTRQRREHLARGAQPHERLLGREPAEHAQQRAEHDLRQHERERRAAGPHQPQVGGAAALPGRRRDRLVRGPDQHGGGHHLDPVPGQPGAPAQVDLRAGQAGAREGGVGAAELQPDVGAHEHAGEADGQDVAGGVVLTLVDLAVVETGEPARAAGGGEAGVEEHVAARAAAVLGAHHGHVVAAPDPVDQPLQRRHRRAVAVVEHPHPVARRRDARVGDGGTRVGARAQVVHREVGQGGGDGVAEGAGGVEPQHVVAVGTQDGGDEPAGVVVGTGVDPDHQVGGAGLRGDRLEQAGQVLGVAGVHHRDDPRPPGVRASRHRRPRRLGAGPHDAQALVEGHRVRRRAS